MGCRKARQDDELQVIGGGGDDDDERKEVVFRRADAALYVVQQSSNQSGENFSNTDTRIVHGVLRSSCEKQSAMSPLAVRLTVRPNSDNHEDLGNYG